jgi:3-oxoacyl-[acyl-carrier protein] reductase
MSEVSINLLGKIALVTGGTRGIGLAIADRLYDAGATVLITGTSTDEINRLNDRNTSDRKFYLAVDFLSRDSMSSFLELIGEYNRIDILVNNAGVNRIKANMNTDEDDYNFIMDINVKGAYQIMREVTKKMKAHGYGRVVNITSIWSSITRPERSLYTASKFAMTGLSKAVAVELAPDNILVNCVAPGFTKTEMTESTNTPIELKRISSKIPAKRMCQPAEIANLVLFLASNLNTYLTGQNIIIDGGYTSV